MIVAAGKVFTNTEKLACAQREVRLRKQVYPGRILTHRMSAEEAAYQIACMEAICADYQELAAKERLL